MKKQTIAMAGGGTGGHVFPIRSLLETLFSNQKYSSQTQKVLRFGTKDSLEQKVASEFTEVTFQTIYSGKWRRERSLGAFLKNIKDLFLFLVGIIQSFFILRKQHVDVIFCKGGYVALPVVIAGKILRKKIIVHESDTHPGLVNRIASRYATKSFTGFDHIFPHAITVGQILSEDIIPTQEDKLSEDFQNKITQIDKTKTILLLTGGSQGAKTLYTSFLHVLEKHSDFGNFFQILVVLGKLNQDLQSSFEKQGIIVFDFLSQKEIGHCYHIADLCISRGGTTSLAEQKLFGIKTIIVPIPRTHDQMDNAKYYKKNFQDLVLDQDTNDFEQQLEQTLIQLKNYKKTPKEIKKNDIIKAKETILDTFFR